MGSWDRSILAARPAHPLTHDSSEAVALQRAVCFVRPLSLTPPTLRHGAASTSDQTAGQSETLGLHPDRDQNPIHITSKTTLGCILHFYPDTCGKMRIRIHGSRKYPYLDLRKIRSNTSDSNKQKYILTTPGYDLLRSD